MGFNLRGDNGGSLNCNGQGFEMLFNLGCEYGWIPKGAEFRPCREAFHAWVSKFPEIWDFIDDTFGVTALPPAELLTRWESIFPECAAYFRNPSVNPYDPSYVQSVEESYFHCDNQHVTAKDAADWANALSVYLEGNDPVEDDEMFDWTEKFIKFLRRGGFGIN
jgi:hypothetical protein